MGTMGMVVFALLFMLGLLLSVACNLTNIIQAFQESVTWGLLAFFVPFALYVFVVKFWSRKWISRVFLMSLGGGLLAAGSAVGFIATMPPEYRDAAFSNEYGYDEEDFAGGQAFEEQALEAAFEPFGEGIDFAMAAADRAQTAQSPTEWTDVATHWDYAIAMMESVPADHPQFDLAQQKIGEYRKNLDYANQNAQ